MSKVPRNELIRLAYHNVDLRKRLLPLIAKMEEQVNVVDTALPDARRYAEKVLKVDEVWPSFDQNYVALQEKCAGSVGIPRILMPVVEPDDVEDFQKVIDQGSYELFKGWSHRYLTDDDVKTYQGRIAVSDVKFTQSHIWFNKLVDKASKYGPVIEGSEVLDMTVILSEGGYLLDGHHRVARTLLSNPELRIKVLYVPMSIDALLEIGRTYAKGVGNKPKASF